MNDGDKKLPCLGMSRWIHSLLLLVVYVAIFQSWTVLSRPWVVSSGVVIAAGLFALGWRQWRRGYFVNGWDAAAHASVALDILVEAVLIRHHDNQGFYLCAAAFVLVVGGYRGWQFSRASTARRA